MPHWSAGFPAPALSNHHAHAGVILWCVFGPCSATRQTGLSSQIRKDVVVPRAWHPTNRSEAGSNSRRKPKRRSRALLAWLPQTTHSTRLRKEKATLDLVAGEVA